MFVLGLYMVSAKLCDEPVESYVSGVTKHWNRI
jgi:hypothetical protein